MLDYGCGFGLLVALASSGRKESNFRQPKKRMNPTESFLVLLLAGLATAVALGAVEVAPAILHSSVSQAFLLVMALVLFAYSPVVGIAAIALFAILMFKRNVQRTNQYTEVVQQFVKDAAAQQTYQPTPVAQVAPSRETFAANGVEGYASPEQVGTYPLEERPQTQASHTFTAMYRPAEDMGDNSFVASPSTLDDYKTQAFAY
jgi:hypothetical protein